MTCACTCTWSCTCTQSSQVESSPIKSSRAESNQVKSSRVESSRVEPSRVESSRAKSNPSQVKSSRVQSSQAKSSRVESNQVKSSRVESSNRAGQAHLNSSTRRPAGAPRRRRARPRTRRGSRRAMMPVDYLPSHSLSHCTRNKARRDADRGAAAQRVRLGLVPYLPRWNHEPLQSCDEPSLPRPPQRGEMLEQTAASRRQRDGATENRTT